MNEEITALMIGGQEDGKFITTDGRPHIVIAEHEEMPNRIPYKEERPVMMEMRTQTYTLIRLVDSDGDHLVYQYEGLQCSVIGALIKGYKGQP